MPKDIIGQLELWIANDEAIVITPPDDESNMALAIGFIDRAPPPSRKIKKVRPVKNPPKWAIIPGDSRPGFGWQKASWDLAPKDIPANVAKLAIKFIFEGDV